MNFDDWKSAIDVVVIEQNKPKEPLTRELYKKIHYARIKGVLWKTIHSLVIDLGEFKLSETRLKEGYKKMRIIIEGEQGET